MTLENAIELLQSGEYRAALTELDQILKEDQADWYPRYLAGQCHRFLGENKQAAAALVDSVRLHPAPDAPVLHALAVAQQAEGDLEAALEALRSALDDDPDHIPSLTTLGIIRRHRGELEFAEQTTEAALHSLCFSHAQSLPNSRENAILDHEPWEQQFHAWTQLVVRSAMRLAAIAGADGVGMPTGESAEREKQTREHGGLLWVDRADESGNSIRHYLPNYFTTLRQRLQEDERYPIILRNRAHVLMDIGKQDEARALDAEAEFFMLSQR